MLRIKSSFSFLIVAALALFVLAATVPVEAAETEVHGYGFQGYLLSNKNNYLEAQEGTWEFNKLAVLLSSKVEDRTTIWLQLFGDSEEFGVDWAFVDYRIANDFFGRIGQSKFPMGIYNEIRDNKMLQLSMLEPAMYRPDVEMIFEAYRGVGVYYNGMLSVDLFGGAPVMEEEGVILEVKNLGGGRITYNTPLEGLKLMASYAAFSEEEFDTTGAVLVAEGHEKLLIGSLDFVKGALDLKAEYASKEGIDEELSSYYVQAGYTIGEKLTPFIRYDYVMDEEETCTESDPNCYQKDITVGVGYKVNPYFAIKFEEHFMEGYLLPLETGEVLPGEGEKKWNMFVAGMNFMF